MMSSGSGECATEQEEFPQCEVVSEKTEDKPTIPDTHINEFVGEVKNLLKIDCHHLYDTNYRINVWAVYRFADRIVPDYVIEQSYFVSYDNEEIVDKTIHEEKW